MTAGLEMPVNCVHLSFKVISRLLRSKSIETSLKNTHTMPIDTLSLEGKVAIVTGSGRENGIGAAIALALARNGAAVTINYVSAASAERAENIAKKIRSNGGRAIVVAADVSTSRGAQTLVQETLKNFGVEKIDILSRKH